MSKYRRKRVLFVCIGNACRSPMAEAIARVDAYDTIDAFSAGLTPIGFVTELTEQTLRRNGCLVEDLESKSISPKIWDQVDIVINMSGRPREQTFGDYSKVEDWDIEDPYGQDADTYQEVFQEIRRRVSMLAEKCREEGATVRFKERRARGRCQAGSPMLVTLDGDNEARVLNISEDGLALSAAMMLSNKPLDEVQVQFFGFSDPLEASCHIVWKSQSQKEAGIQFADLTEEARHQIRNWISEHASFNNVPEQTAEVWVGQNPRFEVPEIVQVNNAISGVSTSADLIDKLREASLPPPASVAASNSAIPPRPAPEKHAQTGGLPDQPAIRRGWRLIRDQGMLEVLARRWVALPIRRGWGLISDRGIFEEVARKWAALPIRRGWRLISDRGIFEEVARKWAALPIRRGWRLISDRGIFEEAAKRWVALPIRRARRLLGDQGLLGELANWRAARRIRRVRKLIEDRGIAGGLAGRRATLPIRRRWIMLLALGSSVALILLFLLSVESATTQRTVRTETTAAVTRKPAASPAVTTIPSVSNPGTEAKTQPPMPSVEPMTVEEVERIIRTFEDDNASKHTPGRASAPTSVAKNASPPITIKGSSHPVESAPVGSQATNTLTNVPTTGASVSSAAKTQQQVASNASPPIAIKTSRHPVENAPVGSQKTNGLTNVLANASISSPAKPQQKVASNASPAPPQLETNNVQPATLAPRPSIEVRAPEVRVPDARARESGTKANSPPAAKEPATPANITGAVAVVTDPYPSLRIPSGSSKKQRQGASLQLGRLLSRIEPAYPEDAKQQGIQGTVKLHAVIDRNGSVQSLQPVNGPPVLVAAAVNAVRQWRFSETLLAGHSVETEEDINVVFRLSNPGISSK
jgi:TonB family protein